MKRNPASKARLLVVDDDPAFARALANSFIRQGHAAQMAHDAASARSLAARWQPSHAVLDLKLAAEQSGLDIIDPLCRLLPDIRIVVLTGYASLATAVYAVKAGAMDYLAKPVDAITVLHALGLESSTTARDLQEGAGRMSLKRLEWEHINRVLTEHDGNVSAAARALGLYRRTLQRKLDKRPVRE